MAYNLSNIRNAMNKVVVVGTNSTFEDTYKYVCTLALNSAYIVMIQSSDTYIEFEILGSVVTKIKSTSERVGNISIHFSESGELFLKSDIEISGATIAVDVGLGVVEYSEPTETPANNISSLHVGLNEVIYNTKLVTTDNTAVSISELRASEIRSDVVVNTNKIIVHEVTADTITIDKFHISDALFTNAIPNVETIEIGNWQINKQSEGNKISITRKQ